LFETEFFQSANYQRIINDVLNTNDSDNEPLNPHYVLECINKILNHNNTPLLCYRDEKQSIKHSDELTFKCLFRYALYEYLAPKRCICEYKFNKTKLDIVVNEIISSFDKALTEPGEMVGVSAAQSAGEPLTQMNLSSFHKSGFGVAGLQGTPRLKEILGNGKKIATPLMFVYLKEQYRKNKEIAHKIASGLRFTTFNDIVTVVQTIYDPFVQFNEDDEIDKESLFSTEQVDIKSLPWLYRIELSREKLLEFNVTMVDIKAKFMTFWQKFISDNKKNKHLTSKIVNACILTNYLNSKNPIVHIRIELTSIEDKTLTDFRNLILEKFYIKGTDKIQKIEGIVDDPVTIFDEETGGIKNESEWVIYTDGIDFDKIRLLPQVDQDRIICNDIRTTYELYGIEATRSLLIKEIGNIFPDALNFHHVAIICDLMTHTGTVTSIDRFGLNKLNIGVLSKATFEETMEILTDAAYYNQSDHLKNVSSSIMLGKPFKGGTGMSQIMMDNEILEGSEFNTTGIESKGFKGVNTMSIIDDILNNNSTKNLFVPKE